MVKTSLIQTLAAESSDVDVTSRVLAIVALIAAVAALVWQVLNYVLTGRRVKVRLAESIMVTTLDTTGAIGPDLEEAVQVIIVNKGRLDATVKSVWISVGPFMRPVPEPDPATLPHGDSVEIEDVLPNALTFLTDSAARKMRVPAKLRAIVFLGDGSRKRSKPLLIEPEGLFEYKLLREGADADGLHEPRDRFSLGHRIRHRLACWWYRYGRR